MKRLFMELEIFFEEQYQKGIEECLWKNIPLLIQYILKNNEHLERVIYALCSIAKYDKINVGSELNQPL